MKAFISGDAGLSVIIGPRPQLRTVNGSAAAPWNSSDALRVFDGCSDVRAVDVSSVDELDRKMKLAWASNRVLRLFLFLIDPEEPECELVEYAECVAELLEGYPVLLPLQHRLAAAPLPSLVEVTRVLQACASVAPVRELFQWLLEIQRFVVRADEAYRNIPITAFEKEEDRHELRTLLTDEGSFFRLVDQLSAASDLTFLRLEVTSRHRALSKVVSLWFGNLQPSATKLTRDDIRSLAAGPDPVEEREDSTVDARQPSYAAFTKVMAQQQAITTRLHERDIDSARRQMTDMIAGQQMHSTPDQIAKSWSRMSHQAKSLDLPDLALEWADEATRANPADPMTFGHLADALIDTGQYSAAERALDATEQAGDRLFAATGRARIMRDFNRVQEARNAFRRAIEEFENHPGVVHAKLGAAEALRELGDLNGALGEYRNLAIFSPEEPSVWSGLAATLLDLGQIEEALQTYSKIATHDSLIGRLGRAAAYRSIGNLDGALAIFDELLADYPSNNTALCGRGDVLQDKGKINAALDAYNLAIERSPYRPDPLVGKVRILRHTGQFEEAIALSEEARRRFPFDRRFADGFVAIYRAQGRYDEALIAVDELIAAFPDDLRGRIARAGILARKGVVDEAMLIYGNILAVRPNYAGALLGKAALLIRLGRNDEAAPLLPEQQPKTRLDWRRVTLRAVLLESKWGYRSASNMLSRLIPQCPFAVERRRMRDFLATIELQRRRWPEARRLVEAAPEEVSKVIALHVLAATSRTGMARQYLARIHSEGAPADVIYLADEIARRHGLTDEPARESAEWIATAERHILLAEAA